VLRSDVQIKEAAVEAYREHTGLLTANGVSISEQQLTDIQNEALEARADLAQKESQYRNLHELMSANRSPDTTAAALASPVVAQLRAREAALVEQQAQLEMRYSDQHPAVQNGRAEIASVRHQIDAEVARVAAGLQNDAAIARARVGILEGTLARARGELVSNNSEVVRLNELEREAAASRAVYESYLQRQQELSQQGLLGDGDARLVSSATLPTDPSSPHVLALMLAALVIGVVGAGAMVLVLEQLDNTIHTATDAQRALGPGIRTVASLPIIRKNTLRLLGPASRNPAGYILKKPASGFAESIRMLRTSALLALGGEGKRVLAITSAMPNEGKSTTALSLARVCAKSYARVLLIDCDVRRHSLNALLGIRPQIGLLAVIAGNANWHDVVGVDEQSGAHVLPVEEQDALLDWASSPRWSALLEELRGDYDLIVLDCPPILVLAESRKLALMADGVVVIARAGQTPAPAVRATCDQLRDAGANVIGVALNGIDPAAAGRFSYQESLYYAGAMQRYYAD
jgi:Mrp family chromosome partitioning ATPase